MSKMMGMTEARKRLGATTFDQKILEIEKEQARLKQKIKDMEHRISISKDEELISELEDEVNFLIKWWDDLADQKHDLINMR